MWLEGQFYIQIIFVGNDLQAAPLNYKQIIQKN